MAKSKFKSGKKNFGTSGDKEPSSPWVERTELQSRRVCSDVQKLISSVKKLAYFSLKSVLGYCHRVALNARQRISDSWIGIAGQCRKVFFIIKQIYKNFVNHCQQKLITAKEQISKSWLRAVRQFHRILVSARRSYRNFVGLCRRIKRQMIVFWRKTTRFYRRTIVAAKRHYRTVVVQCSRGASAIRSQVIALGPKTVRFYHTVLIAAKQGYRTVVVQCCQRASAIRSQVVAMGLKTVRFYRRIRVATRRNYRNFIIQCEESYKNFLNHCQQKLKAAKQQLNDSRQKSITQYRKACVATSFRCKSFIRFSEQKLTATKEQFSVLRVKALGLQRKVRVAARLGCKNFMGQCQQRLTAAKEKISKSWQKVVGHYRRALTAANGSCRDVTSAVKQWVIALGMKTARVYRKASLEAKQSCKNFIHQFEQKLTAEREQIAASGWKLGRRYLRAFVILKRGCRNFVHQREEKLTAEGEQIAASWRKLGRRYRRILVRMRRGYRNFMHLGEERLIAVSEQRDASWRKIGKRYHRFLVAVKRSYRNSVRQREEVLAAKQEQIVVSWKKLGRRYLRALVIMRRGYRSFISLCRRTRSTTSETMSTSRQNLLRQYQRTLKDIRQRDASSESVAQQNQMTLTAIRRRMSSSVHEIVDKCRQGFADITRQISSLVRCQKIAISSSARVQESPFTYEYRQVREEIHQELSSWISFKEIGSFFGQFTLKLPIKGHLKSLKKESLKLWFDVFLILSLTLYLLIITYIAPGKYRFLNPFGGTNIALGGASMKASLADKYSGSSVTSPPSLAAINSLSLSKKVKDDKNDKPGHYSFWPKRFTLRHVEGSGEKIGFGTDYTTAALMIAPDYRVGHILPILDLRGHRFDNNTYAANIGIAGRYIPSSDTICQILGFNVFYDYREGRQGSYHQIGLGLEVLGKRWDLRANGYAPISVKKRHSKCEHHYGDDFFIIKRQCEFTSYGYNAEIGYYVVRSKDFFLYAAIGPYYLSRRCLNRTLGGEFRIRPQYKDYFALDFGVSRDSVFGTVFQAQVILYLPLYQLSKNLKKWPCNLSDQQIYQPIERFEVMPLGRRTCWQSNF